MVCPVASAIARTDASRRALAGRQDKAKKMGGVEECDEGQLRATLYFTARGGQDSYNRKTRTSHSATLAPQGRGMRPPENGLQKSRYQSFGS